MDLSLLRTFLAVHRAGSLTRAGTLLGLSQPAVTSQIRALERQLGRPLFLRQPRGVAPTTLGEELARKVAPHVDALLEIAEGALEQDVGGQRTVHLAGPPEFTTLRALPALAPLAARGTPLRAAFGGTSANLEALSAGRCDLALATSRPRGDLLTATPLCDEELVLVAAPSWAAWLGGAGAVRAGGAEALSEVPALCVHEKMPLLSHYWSAVFDAPLDGGRRSGVPSATVVAPDLRAVLESVSAGAGMAVLPRYLCAEALATGRIVALLEPPVPPLRTYFVAVRAGSLAHPHIARAHETLLRTATGW